MSGMARTALVSVAALAALCGADRDARACGGCFTGGGESTLVTAHRMALSVSTERTVLWDQIRYQGEPEEFAWVLPVRPGATVELSSDAFFEALDAATTTSVNRPPDAVCQPPGSGTAHEDRDDEGAYYYMGCSMAGCAADGRMGDAERGGGGAGGGAWTTTATEPPPPVEVVHEESIGPYEAVILSSNVPGALYDWLLAHGYSVDPSMEPVIDGYEAEGFDFVGLRLIPGVGTRQMKPVRVITKGASPALPLKMVAAGTGANVALTLFLIGEGRWQSQSFPNRQVDPGSIVWDFATGSSSYGELRLSALGQDAGATWITTYAKPGALLSSVYNPVSMASATYLTTQGYAARTIGELYAYQGAANGEHVDLGCVAQMGWYAGSGSKVVDPCAPGPEGEGGGGAGGSMGVGGGLAGGGGSAEGGSMAEGGGSAEGGSMAEGGGSAEGGSMAEGGGSTEGGGEPEEPTCLGPVGPDLIDARQLACGDLDDVAVALVGMRPVYTWVTRLEANLPREALEQDLVLEASPGQSPVENWLFAASYTGDPCEPPAGAAPPPAGPQRRPRSRSGAGDAIAIAAALFALLAALARRQLRAPVSALVPRLRSPVSSRT